MTEEYYIINGKNRSGPYDKVAIVWKIRSGAVTAQTLLQQNEATDPKPAQEWPEIADFFNETEDQLPVFENNTTGHTFISEMKTGWRFLQQNHNSTVFSGIFVLAIILVATAINIFLPDILHTFAYMVFFVISHFLFSCYMLCVLRMARDQPLDFDYIKMKVGPVAKSLLISSFLVCIPAIIGLAMLTSSLPPAVAAIGLIIFVIPGLFVIGLYAFTPLLILDKGLDFWEGMETSRKFILKQGLDNAGLVYALFVINFLGGLCVLLPLAITLPITTGALANIYDETFG